MHGIVSLLDEQHERQVKDLWEELAREFDIHGTYVTPYPHFSYQIAEAYDFGRLSSVLERFCAVRPAFSVKTTGLGIFTGQQPVLYVPVVRSRHLAIFHRELWQALEGCAGGIFEVYRPDDWVPHVTLAHGDIDNARLAEVIRRVSERDFTWEIRVDNVSLIYNTGSEQGLRARFGLGAARGATLASG